MSFTGRVAVNSGFSFQDSSTGQNVSATALIDYAQSFTEGNGAGQSEFAYNSAQVSTASPVTYDLNSGALIDPAGRAMALTKCTSLVIVNTGSANLTVAPGAANPFPFLAGTTPSLVLEPGACLVLTWPAVGKTVSGAAKTITLTPAAATTWTIQITGNN